MSSAWLNPSFNDLEKFEFRGRSGQSFPPQITRFVGEIGSLSSPQLKTSSFAVIKRLFGTRIDSCLGVILSHSRFQLYTVEN